MKFRTDPKADESRRKALDHYFHCKVCQQFDSAARIALGQAGCTDGQILWALAMEDFIRLHPTYKAHFDHLKSRKN